MNRLAADDTIVAIATPPGRGALAIVRLSGARAFDIARTAVGRWPAEPRTATLTMIADDAGQLIDEVIVVTYRGPASFTGDDAVEITCHGGAMASAAILAALVARGARPAEPGEFTRRAVLNGKLDLLQAEAVGDLVDAHSRPALRVALSQLDGGLSRRIATLREEILGLEAMSAYDIDFPEEDDGPVPSNRIVARAREVLRDVEALLDTAPVGEVVREGATVVIAGPPNVGKSSLFNAFLGRRRAIVTDVPGTTRDALEAVIEIDGWPVRLVDTAGLRESDEMVEQLGIEVSREYLRRADLVLACGDTSETIARARTAVESISPVPLIMVRTKADLDGANAPTSPEAAVAVSATSGRGMKELATAIARRLQESKGALQVDAPLVTRERHRVALEHARNELAAFVRAWEAHTVPAVVAAVHLRDATRHLEEMIGAVDIDDVLDRVFSSFCVGK